MIHIDHTTIRTRDIVATKDFFVGVFDLKVGKRPNIIERNIAGYWLYAGENPIIHIIQSSPRFSSASNYGSEAIDHTAFFMHGYDAFKAKLERLNINYSPMELPDINERRIFLQTPTGILLETVFREK